MTADLPVLDHRCWNTALPAAASADRRDVAASPDPSARAAPGDRLGPVRAPVLGGVVVVHDDGRDIGRAVERCATALADAGITWTGELVRVADVGLAASAVVRALEALTPGVVAVASRTALGATMAERLQVLCTLTRRGWRVLAAGDVEVAPAEPDPRGSSESRRTW